MSKTPKSKPHWIKNTYFWIAAILLLLTLIGLFGGDELIRDPGQKRESNLWLIYLGSAVVMFVNGIISHRITIQQYQEELESPRP